MSDISSMACPRFCHRSLYTWKSVSSLREKFFLQDESSFESNAVTKPVVTQATNRHQIKDAGIIFPLIPLNFLWVKQFGYYSLSKSSILSSKKLKMLKIYHVCSAAKLKFLATFFQTADILRIGIVTCNQSQMKPRIPNFQNMKESYQYL